jgi:hypothetical protein
MKTQVAITIDGKRIFFDEDVDVNADMHGRLARHRASVAASRLSCDVLVVRDIANPGVRTLWVAILLGCPIVSCQTIINQGRGPVIVFQPAIARRLAVYISDEFQRTSPVLAKLLQAALAKPQSVWRLLSQPPTRGQRHSVVFASLREVKQRRFARSVTAAMFPHKFGKPSAMSMGVVCGL